MGGEVIAEKFALLKTRGANGVAVTYLVEDILLGERAVVKVSEGLDDLCLEYLKAFNLAGEIDLPGLLMPLEGGLLEEDSGYYMAFPELGEPSLDDCLRMEVPLSCEDILTMALDILRILRALHGAGLVHLFINPRNIFYRHRGSVTLKDPSLRSEFFARFLEEMNAPDFYYFSPAVMDGGEPGPEADLYALGRLVGRLLEKARDRDWSPCGARAAELERECLGAAAGPGAVSAGALLERYGIFVAGIEDGACAIEAKADPEKRGTVKRGGMAERVEGEEKLEGAVATALLPGGLRSMAGGRAAVMPGSGGRRRQGAKARRSFAGRGTKGFGAAALPLLALLCFALITGSALSLFLRGGEKAPASSPSGGSFAGDDMEAPAALLGRHRALSEGRAEAGLGEAEKEVAQAMKGDTESAATGGVVAVECGTAPGDGDGGAAREAIKTPAKQPLPTQNPSGAAPVASFTLGPAEGRSPLQVWLDASSSHDPDGHIVSYSWSCGGGGVSICHVFESNVIPARIPVTLTVTDDAGNSASVTHYVILY